MMSYYPNVYISCKASQYLHAASLSSPSSPSHSISHLHFDSYWCGVSAHFTQQNANHPLNMYSYVMICVTQIIIISFKHTPASTSSKCGRGGEGGGGREGQGSEAHLMNRANLGCLGSGEEETGEKEEYNCNIQHSICSKFLYPLVAQTLK